MANREQRGNCEKRKPKADKPKPPLQTPSFSQQLASVTVKSNTDKKGR